MDRTAMSRIVLFAAASVSVLAVGAAPAGAEDEATNRLANPGFEQQRNGVPALWYYRSKQPISDATWLGRERGAHGKHFATVETPATGSTTRSSSTSSRGANTSSASMRRGRRTCASAGTPTARAAA
jgi:hypothetical protein